MIANGGAALELQHRTVQILERVNAYLGYGAVAHLKIRQGRLPARRRYASEPDESPESGVFDEPGLLAIADPKLKEALASFGHAVRRGEGRRKRTAKRR